MKLVDICLLKKFSRWPENNKELREYDRHLMWSVDGDIIYLQHPDGSVDAATRSQWHVAVAAYALNAKPIPAWGKGAPAPGSYVEIQEVDRVQQGELLGKKAKVIHTFENQIGDEMVVVEFDEDAQCACFNIFSLRPVRMPEEAEKEARKNTVDKMLEVYELGMNKNSTRRGHASRAGIEALYDFGFKNITP